MNTHERGHTGYSNIHFSGKRTKQINEKAYLSSLATLQGLCLLTNPCKYRINKHYYKSC